MIAVIRYSAGNVLSVMNALSRLGKDSNRAKTGKRMHH